ncbi:single-stranded DNA-binding protein [Cryobacterium frigoriphilum]|uniref:Single-stranded DNA-binding protein n=1 Tax=Cryobacterium frigoriphilum TaxID=1259150 RepID=A0A4R9A2I0_9MICO|nr:single-stranded DNA-binding protein [Cryobacterium frigoriphilum]TFD50473.1 single-stranded DNA-binding protein [Cryobacterium frigoriphilum]
MTLHTQQSLSGFIASEPQQSITEHGETRFYARVGQPHFRREDDGRFTALTPTFHDLVAYRATADRALRRFAKGDSFVAEGYVRTFQVEREGIVIQREEFVAKKIGHDLARTNYEVDRARRASADVPAFQEVTSHELASSTAGSVAN